MWQAIRSYRNSTANGAAAQIETQSRVNKGGDRLDFAWAS
jgi:hypothetical protein